MASATLAIKCLGSKSRSGKTRLKRIQLAVEELAHLIGRWRNI